jgi:hypothetical protein
MYIHQVPKYSMMSMLNINYKSICALLLKKLEMKYYSLYLFDGIGHEEPGKRLQTCKVRRYYTF